MCFCWPEIGSGIVARKAMLRCEPSTDQSRAPDPGHAPQCRFPGVEELRAQAQSVTARREGLIIDLVVEPGTPNGKSSREFRCRLLSMAMDTRAGCCCRWTRDRCQLSSIGGQLRIHPLSCHRYRRSARRSPDATGPPATCGRTRRFELEPCRFVESLLRDNLNWDCPG